MSGTVAAFGHSFDLTCFQLLSDCKQGIPKCQLKECHQLQPINCSFFILKGGKHARSNKEKASSGNLEAGQKITAASVIFYL